MAKNHFIMIKATKEEKERLKKLAEIEGCATVTSFCRKRLFQSLSFDFKLNQILEAIKKKN